eukprot:5592424-Alexandrium_andersonii.AAC.1
MRPLAVSCFAQHRSQHATCGSQLLRPALFPACDLWQSVASPSIARSKRPLAVSSFAQHRSQHVALV